MRSIFAIVFIGGLVSMYVFIPEIIEQLIKMGYLADKASYRDIGWTRFWMPIFLTVALVLLYCISFFIFGTIHSGYWNRKIKKAMYQSIQAYGVKFLYFTFFDKHIQKYYLEHVNYSHRVVQHYEEMNQLEGYTKSQDKDRYISIYFPIYREKLGWPDLEVKKA